MTDCANYGTVSCTDATKAAAFIGNAANTATLTRCYNGGKVDTAFVNTHDSSAAAGDSVPTVTLEDCYYDATKSTKALTQNTGAVIVTMKQDGAAATAVGTATMAELLTKTPFKASGDYKGWAMEQTNTYAMPATIPASNEHTHDYKTDVTPPTCDEKGYTTYTCKICNSSYQSDEVDRLAHVEGEEWVVDKEATEEYAGLRHKACTLCGKSVKSEVIPKLAGTNDDTAAPDTAPATEPTTETPAEEGCGGSIAMSGAFIMTSVLALGGAVVCKKRK